MPARSASTPELRLALIYGGVDYEKQRALLEAGVDVIIATPGRLIDFLKQGTVSFRAIEMMVMDEADRMFELGFIKDIRYILRRMPGPSERQNLLFSATLSHRVLELAYEHMNDPEKIVVESETITATNVRQCVYYPAREEKLPLLLGILGRSDASRSMVFVNTKMACERVALTLERAGYKVGVLSGDVPQRKREGLLGRFLRGELELLVATDVAARGLHIPAVSHVYNFDLPFDAEDYVHRIGRTARLGAEGDAISFACDEYAMSLPDIEAYIEQKIPVETIAEDLLAPLPPRRKPGEGGESIVEDAMADAAETRRKRRERDGGGRGRSDDRGGRRDGARRDGPRRDGPRREARRDEAGDVSRDTARDAPSEALGRAQEPAPDAATGTPAPVPGGDEAPRKRRRSRGGRGRKRTGDAASGPEPREARAPAGPRAEAEARHETGARPERKERKERRDAPAPAPAPVEAPASAPTTRIAKRIRQTFRSLAKRFVK
jgi:ATP-dependent RNA helicase RhlB